MKDFIFNLYQNDNFVIYLTIALIVLIILFVIVLFFGKRDQKLEETKRLQKLELDTFKEEENVKKVEVEEKQVDNNSQNKEDVSNEEVVPTLKNDNSNINVTTFEPKEDIKSVDEKEEIVSKVETKEKEKPVIKPLIDSDESKPISLNELDSIKFDDKELEKELDELENIKKEFNNIKIPELDSLKVKETPIENKEPKPYKAGPQVFSSVFVNNDEEKEEIVPKTETKVEEKPVVKSEPSKVSLFSIEDDASDMELPSLKDTTPKKEENELKTINFDDISGETYNIK